MSRYKERIVYLQRDVEPINWDHVLAVKCLTGAGLHPDELLPHARKIADTYSPRAAPPPPPPIERIHPAHTKRMSLKEGIGLQIMSQVRATRLAKGWTREYFAAQLHVSAKTVSSYESGLTQTIPVSTLNRIVDLLEMGSA